MSLAEQKDVSYVFLGGCVLMTRKPCLLFCVVEDCTQLLLARYVFQQDNVPEYTACAI